MVPWRAAHDTAPPQAPTSIGLPAGQSPMRHKPSRTLDTQPCAPPSARANAAAPGPQAPPPPPSQLAARVRCLNLVTASLAPALGFDVFPDVAEALLLHCQPPEGSEAFPLDVDAAPGRGRPGRWRGRGRGRRCGCGR